MTSPDPEAADRPRVVRQLVTLRRKAGLSQAKLAERIGTGQSAISEMEMPGGNPTIATLAKYAQVFGMEVVVTVDGEVD